MCSASSKPALGRTSHSPKLRRLASEFTNRRNTVIRGWPCDNLRDDRWRIESNASDSGHRLVSKKVRIRRRPRGRSLAAEADLIANRHCFQTRLAPPNKRKGNSPDQE